MDAQTVVLNFYIKVYILEMDCLKIEDKRN